MCCAMGGAPGVQQQRWGAPHAAREVRLLAGRASGLTAKAT